MEGRSVIQEAGAVTIVIPAGKTSMSTTVKFRRKQLQHAIILTSETGWGGSWVFTKVQAITENSFKIVVLNWNAKPRRVDYNARIGYVVLRGRGIPEASADNQKRERVSKDRQQAGLLKQAWRLFAELKVGKSYRVSQKTSLMSTWNPKSTEEALRAASNYKLIPAGGSIKVLEIKMRGDNRWYHVEAVGVRKQSLGKGWVNSLALIGQNIQPR